MAAAVAFVTGHTQSKEYAELPWLLDIVVVVLWVTFAVNFFGTIAIRRGKHLCVYSALPEWASTLGMLFSLVLWMPSWGGMVNGLLTLRGAWHKLREDPILKFLVVAVTYYGMSTFEGPMLLYRARFSGHECAFMRQGPVPAVAVPRSG